MDVLASDIGYVFLVTVKCSVEDNTSFRSLILHAEPLRAQEQTEFQRHVEAWQLVASAQFGSGNIMNAITRFVNDFAYPFEAVFRGIVHLARAARSKS